jgi:hypothetical protein
MDPQAPDTDVKTQARRRLLRGSFSVPAVLAVHNGSALAASSSKLRCAVNATSGSANRVPSASTAADGFERVGFFAASVTVGQTTTTKYYVRVTELQKRATDLSVGFVSPSGSPATDWVEYLSAGPYQYAKPIAAPSDTATGLTAVLFDTLPAAGTSPPQIRLVGFVQPGTETVDNQGAIGASCWSSVRA